jgi:hypothetical protein
LRIEKYGRTRPYVWPYMWAYGCIYGRICRSMGVFLAVWAVFFGHMRERSTYGHSIWPFFPNPYGRMDLKKKRPPHTAIEYGHMAKNTTMRPYIRVYGHTYGHTAIYTAIRSYFVWPFGFGKNGRMAARILKKNGRMAVRIWKKMAARPYGFEKNGRMDLKNMAARPYVLENMAVDLKKYGRTHSKYGHFFNRMAVRMRNMATRSAVRVDCTAIFFLRNGCRNFVSHQ